jgi:hypothetical protein
MKSAIKDAMRDKNPDLVKKLTDDMKIAVETTNKRINEHNEQLAKRKNTERKPKASPPKASPPEMSLAEKKDMIEKMTGGMISFRS